MNSLDQSDELIQRGAELRAQSVRARAAADEKMEKSRRLIAASAQTKVVIRAPILEADRPRDGSITPSGRLLASLPCLQILRGPHD